MRMYVISNGDGEILGTAPVTPVRTEEDAPSNIALIPEQGQSIFEIDLPDEVLKMPAVELHTMYRLEIKRAAAELVEIKKR